MSIVVVLKSKIKMELRAELTQFLEDNLPNVRGFKGCQNVTILFDQDSGDMVFHETWKDQSAHHDYIQFIQNNGVMAALGNFLEVAPEIRYYTILDM